MSEGKGLVFPLSCLRTYPGCASGTSSEGQCWHVSMNTILPLGFHSSFLGRTPLWSSTLASCPPRLLPGWGEEWAPCSQQLTLSAACWPLFGIYSQWWQGLWHLHSPKGWEGHIPSGAESQLSPTPRVALVTSLICLMWFPLLKKSPLSQFSLPAEHGFPSTRRLWPAFTVRTMQSTKVTGITASVPDRTALKPKPSTF